MSLTCDDAPTIQSRGLVERDASRMDRVRHVLERLGVRQCVAFVIGEEGERARGPLERWLDAGYELGNHTFHHLRSSSVGTDEFVESVRRCHALLEQVGAFDSGRSQWFRFPYLDYGADMAGREGIATGLRDLGYQVAHASVDFLDDRFEVASARAAKDGAEALERIIGQRYVRATERAVDTAAARLIRAYGHTAPLVAYFHFGRVSDRNLPAVLERLEEQGARFCSLDEALSDPLYSGAVTGLVSDAPRGTIPERLQRRAHRLLNRLDPTHGRLLGPPWPLVR